ncbi:MAG: winged helix-turn-helix transcriptional regulator [Alkaliphilus sp.]
MSDNIMKYKIAGNLKTTISGKYIYTLLNEISTKTGKTQISTKKISRILKISQSTVRRNLKRLKESNYILIQEKFDDDGTRKANEYIIK